MASRSDCETRTARAEARSGAPKKQKLSPPMPRIQPAAIAREGAGAEEDFSFLLSSRATLLWLRSDEKRDLAFGRVFLKMGEKFGWSSATKFFEGFC